MHSSDTGAAEKHDKLVEPLLEKLVRIKAIARALAECEASLEQHTRPFETEAELKTAS